MKKLRKAYIGLIMAFLYAPILLLIAAVWGLRKYGDSIRRSPKEELYRYILGFTLIICDMSYYWRLAACPWLSNGPSEHLPIGV